jgi:CutA1 divalent ion tolerance protein
MHSYDTPAIMVLPVERLDADYHRWIVEESAGADRRVAENRSKT